MSIDIHKLAVFASISRTGSFSRAAEQLFITQPTASQQLAQLEASLGVRLLDRGTRKVEMTPAGEALLPYAEQMLTLADRAVEAARAAAGLADRTLRLGVGHTLATYLLPELLRQYRERYPDRKVKIALGNTSELLEMVESGVAEVALVGTPASRRGITVIPFMEDRIVVITSPNSLKTETIRLTELPRDTLFVREPGSALHAAVEQILGAGALSEDSVVQLGETEAIKRCVAAGLGWALIQEMAVGEEVRAGKLEARRLQEAADTRSYAVAMRNSAGHSTAANDFVKILASDPI